MLNGYLMMRGQTTPPTVTVASLSGSDLWHARRVM